jgi:hypothetical protein
MPQLTAAQQSAIVMLTAAAGDDDACAIEAADVATRPVDRRVLVGFSILECALAWAPAVPVPAGHPIFEPALRSLRAGHADRVRVLLLDALTGRDAGAYAALLVQFAYLTRDVVPDLSDRLRERGLLLAADPDTAAARAAGSWHNPNRPPAG